MMRFWLCAAAFTAAPAFAHATLESSTPAANAVVTAPAQLDLIFSEEIKPNAGVSVTLNGKNVAFGPVQLEANHSEITAAPSAPLAPGVYVVSWHNEASDDGHKAKGSFKFTVKGN
jgi:copper resistance protein C